MEYNLLLKKFGDLRSYLSGDCATPGNYAAKWDFAYDGDGTRTATLTTPYDENGDPQTAVLTAYYFGGAYELTDGVAKKYYSFGGQTMMRDANGLQYFLTDHLGSTVAVTDASGTLTSQQRYLPFGQTRADVTTPNPQLPITDLGYTGQRQLDEGMGGLMDYKARFYSPYINHFTQPDSIIPNLSNPQSLNRYSYVTNRPVNFNDPTGHIACDDQDENGKCINYELKGKRLQNDLKNFKDLDRHTRDEDKILPIRFLNRTINLPLALEEYNLLLNEDGIVDDWKVLRLVAVSNQALETASTAFDDNARGNTPGNAFQHAYWSALMTKEFGAEFAKAFSYAHELEPSDAKDAREQSFMDLHNNKVGIEIGQANPNVPDFVLIAKVLEALDHGDLYVWDGQDIYFSNECPIC